MAQRIREQSLQESSIYSHRGEESDGRPKVWLNDVTLGDF